jgi:hypothetical protein
MYIKIRIRDSHPGSAKLQKMNWSSSSNLGFRLDVTVNHGPEEEPCLEPGVTRAQADVGGGEQVDPAAHTGGVHGADDRLGTGHQAGEQALHQQSSFHTGHEKFKFMLFIEPKYCIL